MSIEQLHAVVRSAALDYQLDPALMMALVEHESSWNVWAVRAEPSFYEKYISHMNGLTPTEMQLRACSFGLCQVLGQVAREQGFDGRFLTELCDPMLSLKHGCIKLKKCMDLAGGDVHAALQKYNGGGDPGYAGAVLANIEKYKII